MVKERQASTELAPDILLENDGNRQGIWNSHTTPFRGFQTGLRQYNLTGTTPDFGGNKYSQEVN